MIKNAPELTLRTSDYSQERYFLTDKTSFSYDAWVPTLVAIEQAENMGQQRTALGIGVTSVAGYYHGLTPVPGERATARVFNHRDARFRIVNNRGVLTYVRAAGHQIGYQSPDEERPNPAFAVVDGRDGYHRVARDSSEPLDTIERFIGHQVTLGLSEILDTLYPGFDVFDKLAAEGVAFDKETD